MFEYKSSEYKSSDNIFFIWFVVYKSTRFSYSNNLIFNKLNLDNENNNR
jgi:hypothetical protein